MDRILTEDEKATLDRSAVSPAIDSADKLIATFEYLMGENLKRQDAKTLKAVGEYLEATGEYLELQPISNGVFIYQKEIIEALKRGEFPE